MLYARIHSNMIPRSAYSSIGHTDGAGWTRTLPLQDTTIPQKHRKVLWSDEKYQMCSAFIFLQGVLLSFCFVGLFLSTHVASPRLSGESTHHLYHVSRLVATEDMVPADSLGSERIRGTAETNGRGKKVDRLISQANIRLAAWRGGRVVRAGTVVWGVWQSVNWRRE